MSDGRLERSGTSQAYQEQTMFDPGRVTELNASLKRLCRRNTLTMTEKDEQVLLPKKEMKRRKPGMTTVGRSYRRQVPKWI